jgi:hypothetical protein
LPSQDFGAKANISLFILFSAFDSRRDNVPSVVIVQVDTSEYCSAKHLYHEHENIAVAIYYVKISYARVFVALHILYTYSTYF